MKVLSIRLSEAEYKVLEKYAKVNSISMNKAMKDAFFEKLEDEYDIECFDKAYAEYLNNRKTYSSNKVKRLLNIQN